MPHSEENDLVLGGSLLFISPAHYAVSFMEMVHCPRTVGTPYCVSASDFPADQTTIFVNKLEEK